MATDSIVRQDASGFVDASPPTLVDKYTGKFTYPAATTKAAGAKVCGTAALDSSGTVTIATTAVTATSLIFVMRVLDGGTVGGLYTAKAADITAGDVVHHPLVRCPRRRALRRRPRRTPRRWRGS
jgi:hypothetical protein